ASTNCSVTVNPNLVFANTGRILITDNATADPYPSVIPVQGIVGAVSEVTVTLDGFSHTFPDDVNVLLVSPDNSKKVALMMNAGGGNPVNNIRLNFSDSEPNALADETTLVSNTYTPADYLTESGTLSTLPPPAPD